MADKGMKEWRIDFTEKFTDNVVPGSYANDLMIDKDDGESVMGFIKGLLSHQLEAIEREVEEKQVYGVTGIKDYLLKKDVKAIIKKYKGEVK